MRTVHRSDRRLGFFLQIREDRVEQRPPHAETLPRMATLEAASPVLILDNDEATLALERRILGAPASASCRRRRRRKRGRRCCPAASASSSSTTGWAMSRAASISSALPRRPESASDPGLQLQRRVEGHRGPARRHPRRRCRKPALPGACAQAVHRIIERVQTERQVAESEALRDLVGRLRQESQTLETINRLGRQLAGELDLDRLVQTAADGGTGAPAGRRRRVLLQRHRVGGEPVVLAGLLRGDATHARAGAARTRAELKLALPRRRASQTTTPRPGAAFAGMLRAGTTAGSAQLPRRSDRSRAGRPWA